MTTTEDEIFKDDGTFIEKFKCKCGNRDNWDDYYLCTECQSPAKFVQHGREAERQRIWKESQYDEYQEGIYLNDLREIIFGKEQNDQDKKD